MTKHYRQINCRPLPVSKPSKSNQKEASVRIVQPRDGWCRRSWQSHVTHGQKPTSTLKSRIRRRLPSPVPEIIPTRAQRRDNAAHSRVAETLRVESPAHRPAVDCLAQETGRDRPPCPDAGSRRHYPSQLCRDHLRGPQRQRLYSRDHHRGHGRPQAGRVCDHAKITYMG